MAVLLTLPFGRLERGEGLIFIGSHSHLPANPHGSGRGSLAHAPTQRPNRRGVIGPEDEVRMDGWEIPLSLPEFGGYESLQNITDGDEAVFRYVKSDTGFKRVVLHTRGKGTVTVLLDGGIAGCAELSPSGETILALQEASLPGKVQAASLPGKAQELTVRFTGTDALTFLDITLLD